MHWCCVWLVAMLVACDLLVTGAQAEFPSVASLDHAPLARKRVSVDGGRQLRSVPDSSETEEKGVWSWIVKHYQMKAWVANGTPPKQVMKELGLLGLRGNALTTHPNYERYLQFERKAMKDAIHEGVDTITLWTKWNLGQMSEAERQTFALYKEYATLYDKLYYANRNSFVDELPILTRSTPGEMEVKLDIWAELIRSNKYVHEMLGLTGKPEKVVMANPYYKRFFELTSSKQ
uniref:Avh140 n=1 Tax=Phytophthora sojae TaxID=67593 RepID=G1FRJ5_PHYSO|nr:Avh140 [Phytophthora sojae]